MYLLRLLMLILSSSLLWIVPTVAQTDSTTNPESGWPVDERCVTLQDRTSSHEGTILLTGWAGIHGLNAAYDTSVIRIFEDAQLLTRKPRYTQEAFSALSPDGRWWAAVSGYLTMDCPPCWKGTLHTDEILIYDTRTRGDVRRIPHEGTYAFGAFAEQGDRPDFSQRDFDIHWRNNDELILPETGTFTINDPPPQPVIRRPFADTPGDDITFLSDDESLWIYGVRGIEPSPDWAYVALPAPGIRSTDDISRVINTRTGQQILELGLVQWDQVAWSHDSNTLAGLLNREQKQEIRFWTIESHTSQLIIDDFHHANAGPYQTYLTWSHDDRYMAFRGDIKFEGDTDQYSSQLYIADTQSQTIYQTCIDASSFVWSPDTRELALVTFTAPDGETSQSGQYVYTLDTDTWQTDYIGQHEGRVIGWQR